MGEPGSREAYIRRSDDDRLLDGEVSEDAEFFPEAEEGGIGGSVDYTPVRTFTCTNLPSTACATSNLRTAYNNVACFPGEILHLLF
jgi:hypothetical protein